MSYTKRKQFLIVFAAFLILGIPFKVMVLIEGLTEVRPVNAIPPVAGLVCGPIGALACGVGNVVADLVGTFDWTSLLGLGSNMLAAYIPYRLWHIYSEEAPNVHTTRNILLYVMISFVAALAVAWSLCFGLYYCFGQWMEQIYTYIFFNNLGFSITLGLPVFIILTSDEIRVSCAGKPRYRLLKNRKLRKTVPVLYMLLMSVFLIAICCFHMEPAQFPLYHVLSGAGVVGLVLILI